MAAMRYQTNSPFPGDPTKSLEFAVGVLTSVGFRLVDRTSQTVEMTGPGFRSSNENPLRGASTIRITHHGGELALDAELGGVEWMGKFVTWFPNILAVTLGVVLSIVFWTLWGPGRWLTVLVIVIAADGMMWLMLGPYITRKLKERTQRELETLLANAATMGR